MNNYGETYYKELVEKYNQEPTDDNLTEIAMFLEDFGWRYCYAESTEDLNLI